MIGQRLAHFHVTAKLGEGGMGAVYRATDSKLGREVAIKVLPEAVTEDPERLARFEREARVLASLNHPNIASIYEVGAHEGVHFIVMELAPGESLAERIGRGALELEDALPMALKMATALEAAHEQGIMHRDLKPANIQVSDDGDIKILDFGLAKAFEEDSSESSALSNSPTLSRHATQAGVLMGTAAYMSPEQARGKAADRRSDIWAFGVVLWEMLAGKKLFAGDTISDTLAAVLRQDIDFRALPNQAPESLRRLLRRCLERDPTRRLQHIGDARLELEDALASNEPTHERATFPWPKLAAAAVLGALLAASIAYLAIPTRKSDGATEPRRTLIQTEPLVTVFPPRIAPDGRKGLYSTGDRLWLWELDRFEPRSWEGEFQNAFFSPDSQNVAYEDNGELWRMNLETGERRLIYRSDSAWGSFWSTDGTITFSRWGRAGVYRVPEEGGDIVEIVGSYDADRDLAGALPNDRGLLFIRTSGGIDIFADGEWTSILREERIRSAAFSPTGHLFYHRADGLWAIPFSLATLSPTAGPLLVDPIGGWPSFSNNGRLSYKRGLDRNQFVSRDREGRVTKRIGRPQFNLQDPSVSPDGRKVAGFSQELGQLAVWLHEMDSGQARRATFDVQAGFTSATWSPDSRYLYFRTADADIATLDVRGKEALRVIAEGARYPHASPDGRYLVYDSLAGDIFYLDLESDSPPQVFFEGPATERTPRFSIDGSVVAYISDESGRNELYVRRFPSGEGRSLLSTDGAVFPRWSSDGSELFYLRGRDLMAVPVSTGDSFEFGEPEKLFTLSSPNYYEYSVTPDGQFVVAEPLEETSTIAVVDHWQTLFKAANE